MDIDNIQKKNQNSKNNNYFDYSINKLNTVASNFNIEKKSHRVLSAAIVCGKVLLKVIAEDYKLQ